MQPSTVNRTELGVQEWKYALFLRYSLDSPDPPNTATDVMPIYPSSMTSTAIGSASSWRFTTSSVSGSRTWPESIHTNWRARRSPHLRRLRCEEEKGKAVQFQNQKIGATYRGHGTEGRPTDPWPLTEWDIQCSGHVCSEHWLKIPFSKETWKVSSGGRTGKGENLPGGIPPETTTFLAVCHLRWWATGCGGGGYP